MPAKLLQLNPHTLVYALIFHMPKQQIFKTLHGSPIPLEYSWYFYELAKIVEWNINLWMAYALCFSPICSLPSNGVNSIFGFRAQPMYGELKSYNNNQTKHIRITATNESVECQHSPVFSCNKYIPTNNVHCVHFSACLQRGNVILIK